MKASRAREISKIADRNMNHVFDEIKDKARYGFTDTVVDLMFEGDADYLKELGYKVEHLHGYMYEVSW